MTEIKQIDLSLSEQMKGYFAIMEWCRKEYDKWVLSMCITQDQLGKPQAR